jgi:glycosyltransferase involved in cell wall biosynthesis
MMKGESVIVVSEMIKDYVLDNYDVEPSKLNRIYRGINTAYFEHGFQPSQNWMDKWYFDYPDTKNAFVITLPARVTRWKGQEDFIELMAVLRERNLPVHGLIVGEVKQDKSNFLASLKQLALQKGVQQHISFVGHRNDLREVMAISDVVMSMSTQPEAFGRTTIEALSLGVPVIGYAHGGVDEQLQTVFPEGRIKVGDINAAAGLIEKWTQKRPVVNTSHPYQLHTMQEKTLSVYQSALETN